MPSFAAAAQQETNAAYRPAFKQLNRQERRVRNLDRKQSRDEAAYRSWLASTQRSIAAQNSQQQAQLASVEQGFHQQLLGSLGQSEADATARAQQTGGPGVPTPAATHGSVTGAVGDPLTQATRGSAAAASANLGENVIGHIASGGNMVASVGSNNLAFAAAQSAKRKAQTLDAISKLAAARGDLAAKRAADSAKRAAEMQQAAAEQAWKQQQFEAEQAYRQAQLDLGQQRVNTTNLNARAGRRLRRRELGISQQRANQSGRTKGKGGVSPSRQAEGQAKLQEAMLIAANPEAHAKHNAKGQLAESLPPANLKGGKLPSFAGLRDYLAVHGYGAFAGYAAYKRLFPRSPVPLRHIAAIERAYGFRPPR